MSTETLMDGLVSEIERCSKLKVLYDELGRPGAFGSRTIQWAIDNAKAAVASGDIGETITSLNQCRGCK